MEEQNPSTSNSSDKPLKDLIPDGQGNHKPGKFQAFAAIFNGLGIGAFLGLLLGLSVSPVVSGVIGTISSLLAILVGLNEKFLDPIKSLRIGSFGLFSVVGILLGLYIRANNPFAPSLADKMTAYTEIGYTEEEARQFVTGFIQADSTIAKREANVLYTTEFKIEACDFLVYANSETPPEEIHNTFLSAGGIWEELAINFKNDLAEPLSIETLLILRDSFCGDNLNATSSIIVGQEITQLNQKSSLKEMILAFEKSKAPWPEVINGLKNQFTPDEVEMILHSLIKIFNHE
ncbi:hypothetical protein Q4534_12665 [Cyclobacterium sp. 1_MG-2023]|uniref:hypothetical protein n=1 Tax=Cyclobacterium sp. 1_MG-2023 TaxID=3062681 RepID=UPI0026E2FB37|nr:hypothetical protein [Cyclobacterium sp. 1_MG-2023]MDO6438269.1 hypothetical protein [Cyclobacterium sp. 1_MG-2023]